MLISYTYLDLYRICCNPEVPKICCLQCAQC